MTSLLLLLVSILVTTISSVVGIFNVIEGEEPSDKFTWIPFLSFFVVLFCIAETIQKNFNLDLE